MTDDEKHRENLMVHLANLEACGWSMRKTKIRFSWCLVLLALSWAHGYAAHVSTGDYGFWSVFCFLFLFLTPWAFFAQNPELMQ